jgi:hypothetical protein
MTRAVTAIREAVVARLKARGDLVDLLGAADRIAWRNRRQAVTVPSLTYLDFGARPDPTVPLLERTYQFDVWTALKTLGSRIAHEVVLALDGQPMGMLPGGQANVWFFGLEDQRDEPADDADVARTMLQFRVLAYRLG